MKKSTIILIVLLCIFITNTGINNYRIYKIEKRIETIYKIENFVVGLIGNIIDDIEKLRNRNNI